MCVHVCVNGNTQWNTSVNQGQRFLGSELEDVVIIYLKPGNTLLLPSGWIHAVLTTGDSLVFGGNFLCNYSIAMQQKVYALEEKLRVRQQFRHPRFTDVLWYASMCIVGTYALVRYKPIDKKCNHKKKMAKNQKALSRDIAYISP